MGRDFGQSFKARVEGNKEMEVVTGNLSAPIAWIRGITWESFTFSRNLIHFELGFSFIFDKLTFQSFFPQI